MLSAAPELEFLPAALEVERTPPLPVARAILWAIVALLAIALGWACLGQVDIVGIAQGKIVPAGQVKRVQPLAAGIVRAIRVVEGQAVAAGEVLVELDASLVQADRARLIDERRRLGWDRVRLAALLAKLEHDPPPRPAASVPTVVSSRIAREYAAFAAERDALHDELRRQRAERSAVEASIARLEATLPLLSERAEALGQLQRQALAPRVAWLELEEARLAQVHERAVLSARLASSDAARANTAQRLAAHLAHAEARWRHELAGVEARLAGLEQEMRKLAVRLAEHRLTAPVAGTVQQLAVHTLGGVVGAAETLMLIVPDARELRIEAWVANRDIGFVEPGQAAVIKVETFPFTRYGTIAGTIETVSHDAIAHETLGLVYLAQVKLAQTTLQAGDRQVGLAPGMAVTVEVDMGRRRVIEFLLTPLLRYRDEGLTER